MNQLLHEPGLAGSPSAAIERRPWTWRGISLRSLALMMLGPWLMAMVLLMANAWMYLQAVREQATPPWQGLLGTMGAVAYVASSLAAGKLVRPQRAVWWLIGSVAMMGVVAIAAFLARPYWLLLILTMAIGITGGQYFVPFQSRMSHVRPFRTLAWSVACYNFSWGLGDTLGPATSAMLRSTPVFWPVFITSVFTLVHLGLIALAGNQPNTAAADPAALEKSFSSTARQRRLGFVATFAAVVAYLALFSTLYPGLGATRQWSDRQIGLGLLAMALPIPLTAALWARLRRKLEGSGLLLSSVLVSAAALAALPLTASWTQSLVCMFGVGIGTAGAMFHSVYYCNSDPVNITRSVGWNEAVIGAGNVLGPLGLGLIAWSDFQAPQAYLAGAAMLALAGVYILVDRVSRGKPAAGD